MDAAVLTQDGSFVTVSNDLPDKPLRFLLFSAPPTTPAATAPLFPTAPASSPPPSPPPRRDGEAYALFGHNGAVIAVSEAAARARMRAFEDGGEAFGDPLAERSRVVEQLPLRPLDAGPLVPERLDLGALGIDGSKPAAAKSPTPPSTPEPVD